MTVKKTDAARSKATKIESHPYCACASIALGLLAVRQLGERTAEESSRETLIATRFMEGLAAP